MKHLTVIFASLLVLAGIVSCAKPQASASTVTEYSLPTVMQSAHAQASATSGVTSLTVSFAVQPPVGDTVVCVEGDAYNGPVTAPGNLGFLGGVSTTSNDVGLSLYDHVITSADANSFNFKVQTATTWFVNCDDWHGANATQPVEPLVATAFGNVVNSLTMAGITPNEPGTVGAEIVAHNIGTISATDPSFTNSVWTVTQASLSAQELDMTTAWTPFTSTLNGNPSFVSSADSVGITYVMRPLVGNYAVGGRVVAAATPTPSGGGTATPTPSNGAVAAYYPTYIYFGSASGGGGGDDCTTQCANGTILNSANVRYVETGNAPNGQCCSGANWDPSNSLICQTNNVNCTSIQYQSATQNECGFTSEDNEYNDISALYNAGKPTPDPGFGHTATPGSLNNRATAPHSGSCPYKGSNPAPTPTPQSVVQNPAGTGVSGVFLSDWFQSTSFLNSRSWYVTRFDNSGDICGGCVEFGNGSQTAQLNFLHPLWTLYASFNPYKVGLNAGGSGGGNFSNAKYDSSHIVFGATNHIVGDPDGICSTNPGNFVFIQFERPLSPTGSQVGGTDAANNVPYLLDTAAEYYNDAGCNNVDMVELEAPYNSGGTDNSHLRQLQLAVRMLLEPGDYDGSKSHRAWVMQRYDDCSNCINRVAVFPEDGINFVPSTPGMTKWSETSGGDGNGCHSGDSGGAKTFAVACTGTDVNGVTGAVYGRAGECYKFGVDYGACFVLLNQSSATVTVLDTWCSNNGGSACSAYGHVWSPTGASEEQYLQDTSSLGTINPNATGAWGEATEPTPLTIGACPPAATTVPLANDCSVVLLSH